MGRSMLRKGQLSKPVESPSEGGPSLGHYRGRTAANGPAPKAPEHPLAPGPPYLPLHLK